MDLTTSLTVVIVGVVFVCVLLAVLLYYSKVNSIFKGIALPSAIAVSLYFIYFVMEIAGAPVSKFPEHDFQYLGHDVDDGGKTLILWTWDFDKEDYRQYKFAYTRENAKKLNQAREQKQRGTPMKGNFKKDSGGEFRLTLQKGGREKSIVPTK